MEVEFEETTEVPQAIASNGGNPNPSLSWDGDKSLVSGLVSGLISTLGSDLRFRNHCLHSSIK